MASLGVWFASLVVVTFPVLLKPWSEEFGWSRQAVSSAFAIAALVAGVSAAPIGHWVDRFGPRRVAVPALVLLGCTFSSLSLLTPSLVHLYLTFAALGLVAIGTSPVVYARSVSTWFSTRRGLALAVAITGGPLGGMLHPPTLEALSRSVGWRGACVVLGALVLVVGVPVVWRFMRENPGARAAGAAASGLALGDGLRSRAFWLVVLVQFCATLIQNSVMVHLSALLSDRGFSPGQGAAALSAMAGAAILGRLTTGYLVDRVFAVRVLTVLMALAATGTWLLAGAQSFELVIAAAVLVGFATGGESDIVPFLISRYFGLRSFSTLFGFAWLANAIGGALGPVLMGRAFDTTGTYEQTLIRLAFVMFGAATVSMLLPRYGATAVRR